MDAARLQLLHEHYRDTCSVMQAQRKSRDRYFYLIVLVLVLVLFDVYSPAEFSTIASEFLTKQLEVATPPDLRYVQSVVWFLLLGLTVRYCQAALSMERQYVYLHSIEARLSAHTDGAFTREGEAYLRDYPAFLSWAHYLYTLVFPLLLFLVVSFRMWRDAPGWPPRLSLLVWFDCATGAAIWVTVVLYLFAFHGWRLGRPTAHGKSLESQAPESDLSAKPER